MPESTMLNMLSVTRMMLWFTKQLVPWDLQKSNYIFVSVELSPPWSKPCRSRNGCHTSHLPHALLDQNLGFVPTADILVPLICHKSQAEAKVLLPYQIYSKKIAVGWKKTTAAYSHVCMHGCFSFDSPLALLCLHIWRCNHNSLCGISPAQGIIYIPLCCFPLNGIALCIACPFSTQLNI